MNDTRQPLPTGDLQQTHHRAPDRHDSGRGVPSLSTALTENRASLASSHRPTTCRASRARALAQCGQHRHSWQGGSADGRQCPRETNRRRNGYDYLIAVLPQNDIYIHSYRHTNAYPPQHDCTKRGRITVITRFVKNHLGVLARCPDQ